MASDALVSSNSAQQPRESPKYHLLSTIIISVWTVFILGTILIHELAHRVTWEPTRILTGGTIPWIYRSGTRLPSILRTVFSQAHGPITAMHLARLSVGALDVSWASPRTWTEVFWLANRRWSGPVGIAETGWAIASRRRFRVSLGFCLFALLSIVALGTPVVLSRAYPSVFSHVEHTIPVEEQLINSSSENSANNDIQNAQILEGYFRWATGASPLVLMPLNAYRGPSFQSSIAGGDWFIASDSRQSKLTLYGIRVVGECQVLHSALTGPAPFANRCMDEFDSELMLNNTVTSSISYHNGRLSFDYSTITNASSCSNISPDKPFGHESRSSVLFRTWSEDEDTPETILRCSATSGLGTATVDGRSMTYSQFTYSSPGYNLSQVSSETPLDPIAALMWSDLLPFQQSCYNRYNSADNLDITAIDANIQAAAMWDGVVTMASELWLLWAYNPVQRSGIQSLETVGIRRNDKIFLVLIGFLTIWFAGLVVETVALLRPTWSSTFDSYAIARMLQHQPVVSGTDKVWYSSLEDIKQLQQQFEMGQWRSGEAKF